jgi:hypothetical protein
MDKLGGNVESWWTRNRARKGAKHPYLQEGVKSELLIKILFHYVIVFNSALPFSQKNILLDKKKYVQFQKLFGSNQDQS